MVRQAQLMIRRVALRGSDWLVWIDIRAPTPITLQCHTR